MRTAIVFGLVCLLVLAVPAAAQVNVKHVPAKYVPPTDGPQLYTAYCASCHGADLNGKGAVAAVVPKNISLRTQIPSRMRAQTIHGSESPGQTIEMPAWGRILRNVYHGDESKTQLAIYNINRYIQSMQ